jgi:hypothetical protein
MIEMKEAATEQERCAIVVDAALPPGRAANAAAVIALTLGTRHPHLAGSDLIDASGQVHPGLIPIGIAVLAGSMADLREIRAKALRNGVDVVDFPSQGQQTTDYAEFGARVREVPTEGLSYVGIGFYGTRKAVGRIVGKFPLLRWTEIWHTTDGPYRWENDRTCLKGTLHDEMEPMFCHLTSGALGYLDYDVSEPFHYITGEERRDELDRLPRHLSH